MSNELIIDDNRVVSFHYRLFNGVGELIDSSIGQLPLVYMHNSGALIGSLEREFTGRRAGDEFEVVIYCEDGYGYASEELIKELPREAFDDIEQLRIGMRLRASGSTGESQLVTVREKRDDSVVVDANHPLSGQVLHFVIAVVAVRDPTDRELHQGFASESNVPLASGGFRASNT